MTITIREATIDDLPVLCALVSELLASEVDFEPDYDKQYRGLKLLLDDPNSLLLAAEADGKVVGICSTQRLISSAQGGYSILIDDLVIDKNYRQQGLGKKFLDHVADWARARGITRMQLLCDETNFSGQKFYARTGWEKTHLYNYFRYLEQKS